MATIAHIRFRLRQYMTRDTSDDVAASEMMRDLLPWVTDENVADIACALSPQETSTPFGTAVLTRWLELAPANAAAWLATHRSTTEEQNWQIGQSLEKSRPIFDAVCGALPDGALKDGMLNAAALGQADHDPHRALELIRRMCPGEAQTNACETIAYAWAVSDANEATQWILGVEDPKLRRRLLVVGAKALAASDPDLAATWLVAAAKDGAATDEVALAVAESWANKNAPAAARWVGGFADPAIRVRATETVVKQWMAIDAPAASAWVAHQPDGPKVLANLEAEEDSAATPKD